MFNGNASTIKVLITAALSHPAMSATTTAQPTRKGATGVLVLPLTDASSTTMVTMHVMAASPKMALGSWLSDLRMLKAAPAALL